MACGLWKQMDGDVDSVVCVLGSSGAIGGLWLSGDGQRNAERPIFYA